MDSELRRFDQKQVRVAGAQAHVESVAEIGAGPREGLIRQLVGQIEGVPIGQVADLDETLGVVAGDVGGDDREILPASATRTR